MLSYKEKVTYSLALLTLLLTTIRCNGHDYLECHYEGVMDETKCLPNNTYSSTSCKPVRDVTGNRSDERLAWIPYGKLTHCREPKSACRCIVDNFWNWYDQYCECYNPSPVPKFPPIGVIRWDGTKEATYDYESTKYQVNGEVHKLSNGDFLRKDYTSWTNMTSFEIQVADGKGSYTQYTGNTRNKTCNVGKQKSEKTIQSIWGKYFSDDSKINMESSSKNLQTWKKFDNHGDWEYHWTWTVEFDDATGTVVPIRYKYRYIEYNDDDDATELFNYKFTELNEGDKSFHLSDYCTNA